MSSRRPVSSLREARSSTTGTAVLLSDGDRLTVTGDPWLDPADSGVARLFDRLVDVARLAESSLDGPERRAVLELAFGGLATALDYAEAPSGTRRPLAEVRLAAALERAEARLSSAAGRRARQRYLEGMLLGLGIVLVVAGLTRLGLVYVIRDTVPGTMLFPTVLVAGAFGGFVSVLTRITRNDLAVPIGGRGRETRLLGGFRPIVGVVFGTALAVLVLSDVLPLKLPEGDLRPFSVVGLAFAAGFAERFAQEVPRVRRPSRRTEVSATRDA